MSRHRSDEAVSSRLNIRPRRGITLAQPSSGSASSGESPQRSSLHRRRHHRSDTLRRRLRHTRQTARNRMEGEPEAIDVDSVPDTSTCIDLTEVDDSIVEVDLTNSFNVGADNPIVITSSSHSALDPVDITEEDDGSPVEVSVFDDTEEASASEANPSTSEPATPTSATSANPDIASPPARTITCTICFDGERTIRRSGRKIMSTNCGHLFCNTCIECAIKAQGCCPTCRRKLTQRQIHPIFL